MISLFQWLLFFLFSRHSPFNWYFIYSLIIPPANLLPFPDYILRLFFLYWLPRKWKKNGFFSAKGKSLVSSIEYVEKLWDLSRSSQVDIANEIYGVMIPFKPRRVSIQFFFILEKKPFILPSWLSSASQRNLEKSICCNLSDIFSPLFVFTFKGMSIR